MFTPKRDSPGRGSPYGSPYDRQKMSPFANGSSVTRSGKPRGGSRPSLGMYESSLVSGKSHGTPITIEEAPTHRVMSYGKALPVQVSESLSKRSSGQITCKLDMNGWAWLVNGKSLLVWKYVPSLLNKNISCCELPLPTSDLYHKARLTCVMPLDTGDGQQHPRDSMASVVNISPGGTIRFWPNIANPSIFVESSAGHRGKEFHCLAALPPHGCILMTADGEVLLVSPNQAGVICRSIIESAGLLSGVGRKMSSFLFGNASSSVALHLPKLSVAPKGEATNKRQYYSLLNGNLQKWELAEGREKLLSQIDLLDKLEKEIFNVIEIDRDALVKIEPLDITSSVYSVTILASVVVRIIDGLKVILLLGTLQSSGKDIASSFDSLVPLEYAIEIEDESAVPEFELVVPPGSYQVFVFNRDVITVSPVSEYKNTSVDVKFPNESSKVVGGGCYGTDAVFLSKRHGLFIVVAYHKDSPSSVLQMEPLSETKASEMATSSASMDITEVSGARESGNSEKNLEDVIREAFYKHCEDKIFEATEIISMIPSEAKINEVVVGIGREIIDAIPASDPRWAQHALQGAGQATTDSVLIMRQLKDKERVFEYFLKFLDDVEIFDKLTICHDENNHCYTKFKLCEQAEKLNAAQALQTINLKEDALIQEVIKSVVHQRDIDVMGDHLTDQDIFFREVSKISELFPALVVYEEEALSQFTSMKKQIELISDVNNIIIAALKNSWLYRQSKASFFHPTSENIEVIEYIPWTATNDAKGIRTVLKKQILLTEDKALANTDNPNISKNLLQQAVDLSDLLLDGYVTQLQFLKATKNDCGQLQLEFETERKSAIEPLIQQEHYKMALALAEKYKDFALMIEICDREGNHEKLEKYKATLVSEGFLDFLFKWYLDRGELGKLLTESSSSQLEKFLSSHHHLSWLHFIGNGEYEKASDVLKRTAKGERSFLARKKTMLSIAKLCLLATEEDSPSIPRDLEEIQNHLDVILHQETLPAAVVENAGIDPNSMPPLTVEDLIELYTGENNTDANEYDFKRALDLVPFVDPLKKQKLWNRIWCRSIIRDDWNRNLAPDPLTAVQGTVFCKCARLFHQETSDVLTVLPTLDVLQSSEELQGYELSSNDNFMFLIKAFYESLASR
ncbi:nuclear pore complex protein Nup133-like isoform X2 [Rhopilema esculentum]|uniref:nuclear pore complex protein Nup133-like isoform X2 n=1 Tax=Rhopilema esculentum TaxID=499914 RepID=UPI0031D24ECC